MNNEQQISQLLQENGFNLNKRFALRTLIFERPKLYPASWSQQKWESFELKNTELITQMKDLLITKTVKPLVELDE